MKTVGLDPDLKRHVRKYSLGMRQRLGLAQAIMEDSELLILDEPMNGLDKGGVSDMRKYLLDLKAKGKSILIASHSAEDIDVLCDTVRETENEPRQEHSSSRKAAHPEAFSVKQKWKPIIILWLLMPFVKLYSG